MTRWLSAFAVAAALVLSPAGTSAQEVVHGADSLFVSPSVKLAWAVKRGASETETLVVIRVIAEASHRVIRLDGVDPFTKDRKAFVAARPLDHARQQRAGQRDDGDHVDHRRRHLGFDGMVDDRPEFAYAGVVDQEVDGDGVRPRRKGRKAWSAEGC